MKTLKYIARVFPFFKSLSKKTKENTDETTNFEFAYPKFGINLYQSSAVKKESKSLLTQMYSEENEVLFI